MALKQSPHLTASLGNIKALAFDAYGTLFDVFSVTALCEDLFPGRGAALTQLWRVKQLQYSLLRSLMGRYEDFWQLTQDALRYASEQLKLNLTAATKRTLMDAYLNLAVFPDVVPGLAALRQQGLRLAILSNGAPAMLEGAVTNAGIDTAFDAIISADELKIFKPSPRVYRSARTRLRVTTDALGFVSSNSWDISGAASVGLTTFWLQRSAGEPADYLGFPATYVVGSLDDVSRLFA